jgi:hypothetical protein
MVPGPGSHTPFALGKFQEVPEAVAFYSETVQLGDLGTHQCPERRQLWLKLQPLFPYLEEGTLEDREAGTGGI